MPLNLIKLHYSSFGIKQNGRKCRAQQMSAEAAPSTSGRKRNTGNRTLEPFG